jgi:hypothetical protein
MQLNAFASSFGVLTFQTDPAETQRVVDYCGGRFVVSAASNKLVRVWDAMIGKVSTMFVCRRTPD